VAGGKSRQAVTRVNAEQAPNTNDVRYYRVRGFRN
jgi:hypothetical protein